MKPPLARIRAIHLKILKDQAKLRTGWPSRNLTKTAKQSNFAGLNRGRAAANRARKSRSRRR